MIATIHLFIIVTSFNLIVNLCKLKILYHEELLIVFNEKTQENNPFKEMEIYKWGKVKEIKA